MKVDSWGHPSLTEKQVVAIAENMIPTTLRPYYVGIDAMRQTLSEPWSEWNTDIVLFFKYPVSGCICDDARYTHGNLYNLQEYLKELYVDENSRSEELEDYDSENDNLPVKRIKPLTKKIVWHKPGYNGED